MYDPERRERFLAAASSDAVRESYRKRFQRLEPFEEKAGMHIEEMTADMLSEAMEIFNSTSAKTVKTLREFLRAYARWCAEQGFQFNASPEDVVFDVHDTIREVMISSPHDLQSRMNRVFEPENKRTTDCVYRAYLWMMYSGITGEQAVAAKTSDVDITVPCVFVGGIPYKVPLEAIPSLYVVSQCDSFAMIHPNRRDFVYPRPASDQLLRTLRSTVTLSKLESRIRQKVSASDAVLHTRDVAVSGLFYRTWLYEKETGKIDFTQYLQDFFADNPIYSQYNKRDKQKRYQTVKSAITKNYKNWKEAFAIS